MNLLKHIKRILNKTSVASSQNTKIKMEKEVIMAEGKIQKYQWIKSERMTEVVQVAEVQPDDEWLYFTDGTRINNSLVGEFLMEVPETTIVGNEMPATQAPVVTPSQKVSDVVSVPEPPEPSIMGKMIMKMSKKNVVNVPIQININIPTPSIYTMLSDGMEKEDLNNEIMEVVLQQIEINKLREYINENVSSFLTDYYTKN